MEKLKMIVIIVIIMLAIMIFQNKVEAKSYSVENMDIQATINTDGSVGIEQTLTYKFNGSYNGIYINVPYGYEDKELEDVIQENRINDNLYNGKSVTVTGVSETGTETKEYAEVNSGMARNGMNGFYEISDKNNIKQIKVYSPSQDTTKTFRIDYTIYDLCVKHNDIGELYYNFIGGAWEVEIKNLNIDIYLPMNTEGINVWGHGPYNGKCKIISNSHANFKVKNVKPGQYVAARVLFDNYNIQNATKISNIYAKQMIYQDENAIIENKKEKNAFTRNIVIFAICMLIYWIILMLIYEKDKKYMVSNIEEDKLFEKYNPMIAGCIQGSRTILARDIIAVILNLIDKKIINLEFKNAVSGKDNYIYIITKNKQAEEQMDSIEKYVYDWVFENKDMVNLAYRLKDMPKDKLANKKFKELNDLVERNLATLGANQAKVPMIVRAFNMFLFILSIVVVVKHIMFNGYEIYDSATSDYIIIEGIMFIIMLLPFFMGFLYLPLNLIVMVRHKINKTVQKISGQKVVTTTISLLILFGVIIALTAIFSIQKYIIADEILICIATILILTDNLMLKNNAIMIEDYSKLNTLKYKIENYSIMEDKDIEQVTLWEKYLSYAVSFGIANKIVKRIQGLNLDDDLLNLVNQDSFLDFITSDYYLFYTYTSLDRKFVRAYRNTTGKVISSLR